VLAAFPFDIIAFFLSPTTLCPFGALQMWSIFRLNKCFRVIELSNMMKHLENSVAKAGIKFNKNAVRVFKLVFVILCAAHWLGGLFFILGNLN
jgi:hypothetical protein